MDITQYNFPEGTKIEMLEKRGESFYVITYESGTKVNTPFGVVSEKYFSTENRLLADAVTTFEGTLEANGFTKINNIWQ